MMHDILLLEHAATEQTACRWPRPFAGDESRPRHAFVLFKAVHLRPGLHNALMVPIEENDRLTKI